MAKTGVQILMEVLQEELLSLKTDSSLLPEEETDDFNDYYMEIKHEKTVNEFELCWRGV